jgi:hydroxymethylbilane synthase
MSPAFHTLRLGTRGSLLARTQSQLVADGLRLAHPAVRVELVIVQTTGDRITDRPLHDLGGKGLFTKELEQALIDGQVDFAVHSFKDVPVTMPLVDETQLVVAAVPRRVDPVDVLVRIDAQGFSPGLMSLPPGARVGTGSLRRRCQLLAARPDLRIEPLRGNVDTRVRKLRQGQYDAVVLAKAGLVRSNLYDAAIMTDLPADLLLPAPGQGALALQCRHDDDRTVNLLRDLDDPPTWTCVNAERAIVAGLGGDCHSPIAALATIEQGRLRLRTAVGARGGALPVIRSEHWADDPARPQPAVDAALADLERQGAQSLLHGDR